MKLVAFMGSPRPQGNTAVLLREALEGAREAFRSLAAGDNTGGRGQEDLEIEVFQLNWLKIKPCQGCNKCAETGNCIYHDDMDQIYRAVEDLDGLILASPTFFFSLSAQTKAMIDRFQSFWARKYILKRPMPDPSLRPGAFLSTAGLPFRPEIFAPSQSVVRLFFRLIGVAYQEELLVDNTDRVPVAQNIEAQTRARQVGRALIEAWAAARDGINGSFRPPQSSPKPRDG